MNNPEDELKDPEAKQVVPQPIDEVLSVGAWLNLSHWVMKAIELVSGVNPGQWVSDKFTGDWEAFAKAGDALQNVGKFYQDYGDAISRGEATLFKTWEGNAAENAKSYFDKLSEAVSSEDYPINRVGKEMRTVSYGVWGAAKEIDGLLETLLDQLIGAGIALAAGAASSETIIGGILGGAAAAWEIKEATTTWKQIVGAHDKAYNIAVGFTSLVAGELGALKGLEGHPLPKGAYDHPGVK